MDSHLGKAVIHDPCQPSANHHIVPTLVLASGALSGREFKSLETRVLGRVSLGLPRGFVHWPKMAPNDKVLLEKVDGILAPFLKLDYIERLQARGAVQNFLAEEREYDLHIIVVHKREKDTDPSKFLRDLGTKIRQTMSGGVRYTLILIAIGEGTLDLGEDSPFWPCFRLGAVSYGRYLVSDARVFEACQNLLVALATSGLAGAIEQQVTADEKKEIRCIWLGASALVVDVASMQNYVRLKVLHHLVDGMLALDPTRAELQTMVESETKSGIAKLQGENLAQALALISDCWTILRKDDEEEYHPPNHLKGELALNRKTNIYRKIVKPELDLARELKKHYVTVRERLTKNLGVGIRERYEKILEEIFELFSPPKDNSTSQTAGEWRLTNPPLYGLATVTHVVETAAEDLIRSEDIDYRGLRRHEIGSDDYLACIADEDAQKGHRSFVQFRRKERVFLSRVGFLIKLIPAWTLLMGALLALPNWGLVRWVMLVLPNWPGEWCAAVLAFLALAVIATIEYISWQIELANSWSWLRRRTLEEIGETVLQITYKVLRDYRMLMVGRLQEVGTVLRGLLKLLKKVEEEYRSLTVEIEGKLLAQQQRQSSIYWLSDLETCDSWAREALKAIDTVQMREDHKDKKMRPAFNIYMQTLLKKILTCGARFSYKDKTERVLSSREIYDQIETMAQQSINIVSNERFEFYMEREEVEHEGKQGYDPVGGLTSTVPDDWGKDLQHRRISKADALQRIVEDKPVYTLDTKRRAKRISGREPLNFLHYNDLDILALVEHEESLRAGKRWSWLYQRAIPLGKGERIRALDFLTSEDNHIWQVHANGQYSPHWIWERGEVTEKSASEPMKQVVKTKSVLANEIGCIRALVEYKEAVN